MTEETVSKSNAVAADEYESVSEVFAYAGKLVENDLAAAVRIFRQPRKSKEVEVQNHRELAPA